MIYEICNMLFPLSDVFSFCRLVNYITFRAIMAALTSVIFIFLVSRHFILFMHHHCLFDQVRETGVHSAFDKCGTPTMGGFSSSARYSVRWCCGVTGIIPFFTVL